MINEEKRLYLKKFRQDNKVRIAKVSQVWYLKNKKHALAKIKEWCEKNKDRVVKQKNEYHLKNLDYEKIKRKTRYAFKHLKTKCQECPEIKDLHFHHLKPLAYDNFKVLCRRCHMREHGTLLEVPQ